MKRSSAIKAFRSRAALLLAAVFLLTAFSALLGGSAFSAGNGVKAGDKPREDENCVLTLSPRLSEGLSLLPLEGASLSIQGLLTGDHFIFGETATLGFSVSADEGWSWCPDYSVFFKDDARAAVTGNQNGGYDFRFYAVEGESVLLSAAFDIRINAAAESLPRLYIDASVPFSEIDREHWVDAEFRLELGSKHFESGEYEGEGKVKGRGNSSWTPQKKPYSIKLESKKSLLDIPKTKKYAIIPSYYDISYMRNYITYKGFGEMISIWYVPKCEFVEVYLNGEYRGVYLLTERVDIEKTKVDIEEADIEHITGGYLIEKDVQGKFSFTNDVWFHCPYWANQAQDYFTIKAPDPDDDDEFRQAMIGYLEPFMQRVHNAIINGQGDYRNYVDIASWADITVLQELCKNPDGNFKTSCFMYKLENDDHLYMTAPWDFDFAYGLVDWTNADEEHNDVDDCPQANTADGFMTLNSSSPWFLKLWNDCPEFAEAVKCYYTEYRRGVIPGMLEMIDEQAAYLSSAVLPDAEMWNRNFTNGVRRLRNWLNGRIAWLDGEWLIEDGEAGLDEALNIEGGTIRFESEDEGFIAGVRDAKLVGIANGSGEVSCGVTLGRGDFVRFEYNLTGGALTLLVNGEAVSAYEDGAGAGVFRAPESGEYALTWRFEGEGCLLDEVGVNFGTVLGDCDMSGQLSVSDAIIALRLAMGVYENENAYLLADISGDGEVTVSDAITLLRLAMGIMQ
ncbi:MAG: CotH kinase family protein [Clostridia bacterium]|nr:CotH kinase family protein [Clostridia bacterium]